MNMESPAKSYTILEFTTSPVGEALLEIVSLERIPIPIEYYNNGLEQEFLSMPWRTFLHRIPVNWHYRLYKPGNRRLLFGHNPTGASLA